MSNPSPKNALSVLDNFVVGLGASVGELQALEEFVTSLPTDPGVALVVIQHCLPDFCGFMVEVLQQRTQLPVRLIEDGTILASNHIYVLPPRAIAHLDQDTLRLTIDGEGAQGDPINQFFISLAQERGDRAIGILLAGADRDGREGLKAISQAGGVALLQSPETAQFGAISHNPLSAGLVDEILAPSDLARAVADIVRFATAPVDKESQPPQLLSAEQLGQVLELLQTQENLDFTQYKTTTLQRRIMHRLLLSKVSSVGQYITYLSQTPKEVATLRQDLLIGATRFFRDPDMWDLLQTEVLPEIIASVPDGDPLRFWVAACASGEEAYTLAIIVHEVLQQMGRNCPVKIFATDIDQEALTVASRGIYPASIMANIGEVRLSKYFTLEETGYSIQRFLRSQIVFASHDMVKNPGFSQMHLISCRNLLIYMQTALQEQVLKLLHFSLAPRGVLVLGASEHLGNLTHAFEPINPQWQIFRKRQEVQLALNRPIQAPTLQTVPLAAPIRPIKSPYEKYLASLLKLRFGDRPSTCLLIDQEYQIRHIFLNTARLLDFPLGVMNTIVLDLVLPALRLPLSTALHRAKRDRQSILYSDIPVPALPAPQRVNLWVGPADSAESNAESLLIVLLEIVATAAAAEEPLESDFDPNLDLSQQLREVEFELQQTRQNLQATIQELETANEEHQATNEELLASNEELQGTNEELQSVNEELYNVNAEKQQRIQQLTELTADIGNLLQSTDIGVVFLDRELKIRKFTQAATLVFNFRPGDVGRPLNELTHYLDIHPLADLIRQVGKEQEVWETEARNLRMGDRLLLRVLPYRQEDGSHDGFVLTLVVINDLKQIQDELLQSNTVLELLYRNSPFGLCLLDSDLRFIRLNQALADMNGLTIDQHLGQRVETVLPELYESIQASCQEVLATRQPVIDVEILGITPAQPNVERIWIASYYPIELVDNQQGIGAIIAEVTENKRNEQLLQTTLDSTPTVLFTQDENLRYTWIHNPVPGFTQEEFTGRHDRDLLPPAEAERLTAIKQRVLESGEPCHCDFTLETDGSVYYFDLTFAPQYNVAGDIIGITGVGVDVTQVKQSEAELRQVTQRLEQAQEIVGMGDWQYDFRTSQLTWSNQVFRILGLSPQAGVPSVAELWRFVHPQDRPLLLNWLEQVPVFSDPLDRLFVSPQSASDEFQGHSQDSTVVIQDKLGDLKLDLRIYPSGEDTPKCINLISRTQHDTNGEVIGLYGTVMDITERKQIETELQQQAFFDRLTKLPNRAFFLEHLKFATSKVKRDRGYQFAVLYLDVDGFKEVNDTLGHAAGDQLLMEVAQCLEAAVRPGDIVSRLGGDEFAILLGKMDRPEEAMQVAFRIQQAIATPVNLITTQVSPTVSIGLAFFDVNDQWNSDTAILENADIAMYQAKRQGPGNIALFQSSMRMEETSRIILKAEIKQALEQNGFVLHYQPLVDLSQQVLIGFETLVRWRHPQRGLLFPLEFLPLVQSAHLMPKLETWIFRQACHQLSQWTEQFSLDGSFRLNVNISPDFIKHSHFINNLSLAISESLVNPAQLCLEVTESSFIGYGNFVESILRNLKRLGIKIVLDDFGTGYSSLSYLHRLPIDAIKIDQSFIQSLGMDDSLMGITRGIVGLANHLNLDITAEGVETLQQVKLVRDMGCHYGQGYFFSHPLPVQAATELLQDPQSFAKEFAR